MAPVENFAATPLIGRALLTTVNSSRDGSGAIETVLTAGTYGCHINRIRIKAMGSTTAGMVRLYIHDGTIYTLYDELTVTAVSANATTPSFKSEILNVNLDLPANWSLRASSQNGENIYVIAEAGGY